MPQAPFPLAGPTPAEGALAHKVHVLLSFALWWPHGLGPEGSLGPSRESLSRAGLHLHKGRFKGEEAQQPWVRAHPAQRGEAGDAQDGSSGGASTVGRAPGQALLHPPSP